MTTPQNSETTHTTTTTATGAATAAAERESIRPQLIGVWALGVVGSLAVIAIIVLGERTNISAAAFSTLGAIAAAAVGGIAGMLTSTKSTTTTAPVAVPVQDKPSGDPVADDDKEPVDPIERLPPIKPKKPEDVKDQQPGGPAEAPAVASPAVSFP
jgi:hypothetical protein